MGLGGLGMWEMIMIFLVVLLLFGAKRLPEIGSSLGKGIREFKGSIKEIEKEVKAVDEPLRDAVPPASTSPGQPDEGPRRLTTSPGPESAESQGGGVPSAESQPGGVPSAESQPGGGPPDATSSDWSAAIEESAEETGADEPEEEAVQEEELPPDEGAA